MVISVFQVDRGAGVDVFFQALFRKPSCPFLFKEYCLQYLGFQVSLLAIELNSCQKIIVFYCVNDSAGL